MGVDCFYPLRVQQQEEILLTLIGMDTSELARRAARRMVEDSPYVDL